MSNPWNLWMVLHIATMWLIKSSPLGCVKVKYNINLMKKCIVLGGNTCEYSYHLSFSSILFLAPFPAPWTSMLLPIWKDLIRRWAEKWARSKCLLLSVFTENTTLWKKSYFNKHYFNIRFHFMKWFPYPDQWPTIARICWSGLTNSIKKKCCRQMDSQDCACWSQPTWQLRCNFHSIFILSTVTKCVHQDFSGVKEQVKWKEHGSGVILSQWLGLDPSSATFELHDPG